MMLKLSVTIMSVFIVGIKITLCWIFLFSVLLLIPNLVYNIHDSKQPSKSHRNKIDKWLWYIIEVLHLVLTSLPFEKGFNNLKLKKAINKVCWYVIFLFGLISTTLLLENSSRDSCLAKNVIYEPAANDLTRDKPDCENLCH